MVGNEKRHCLFVLPQIMHVACAKNSWWHGAIESHNKHFSCKITIPSDSASSQREKVYKTTFLSFKIQSEFLWKHSPSSFIHILSNNHLEILLRVATYVHQHGTSGKDTCINQGEDTCQSYGGFVKNILTPSTWLSH